MEMQMRPLASHDLVIFRMMAGIYFSSSLITFSTKSKNYLVVIYGYLP